MPLTTAQMRRKAAKKKSKALKIKQEAAIREVVSEATRSRLTTPEYKITKTTVKPLPGSYGSKQ